MSPRRALLFATWLAGTLLATAIVYEAVHTVAGQVTELQVEGLSRAGVEQALKHTEAPSPTSPQSGPVTEPTPSASVTPGSPPAATPRPTGPGPAPATPAPQASDTRTFSMVGGTASVTCSAGQITVNWATPNDGFQVETGSSNGGALVEVRFRSDTHESRLEAWCSGGLVQSSIREESS